MGWKKFILIFDQNVRGGNGIPLQPIFPPASPFISNSQRRCGSPCYVYYKNIVTTHHRLSFTKTSSARKLATRNIPNTIAKSEISGHQNACAWKPNDERTVEISADLWWGSFMDSLVALGTWMSRPNLCSMSWRYRSSFTRSASYPAWKKLSVCSHFSPSGTRS